jgi:hypothetical protein
MEHEGSLLCSQEPAIGPYPEPDKSIPHPPKFIFLTSILILFSHLSLGLPSGLVPSGFPTEILFCISHPPCMLRAAPLSSSLIWWS